MVTIQNYVRAQSIDEAYELNQKKGSCIIGGMLWTKMQDRLIQTAIDMCDLGLDKIEEKDDEFIIGAMAYPEHICEKLDAVCDLTAVDALQLAVQAGSQKCVNVVLIGVMAKSTEIPYEKWLETIRNTVPAKFLDMNLKAFELGYQAAK